MPFQLTVDGTPAAASGPTVIHVGQSVVVSFVPPNVSATSDSAHVIADTESAPNTRSVVLRAVSAGTAHITLDFEGIARQTFTVTVPSTRHAPSGPLNPIDHP